MDGFIDRKRIRLFHYRSERRARTLIRRLQMLHPDVVFTTWVRGDFRYYVWATCPDGKAGWVQRVSRSSLTAILPNKQEEES